MATKAKRFCEAFETFDEMVEYVTIKVHSALLEGGGKQMKSEIHLRLDQALRIGRDELKKVRRLA